MSPDATDADPATETLLWKNGAVTVKVVCADNRDMLDSEQTIRHWTSPFYLSGYMESGTLVVLSDHNRCAGAVVLVSPDENGVPLVTIKETYASGYRTSVRVTLTAPLDEIQETYRLARETLQIDHQPILRFFGCDVLDAVLA